MDYAYGIDLGTTNSCIARVNKKGEIEIIKNMEGDDLTPSVVQMKSAGFVVGKTAKKAVHAGFVAEGVKHHMGKEGITYTAESGVKLTPVDISAEILKKVVRDAEKRLDVKIKDVVISVPAYFSNAQITATIDAGKKAGLNVIDTAPEPAAAALAYGEDKDADDRDKTVLVYDLGGGTFDVTLVKRIKDAGDPRTGIITLALDGDHNLGGKNWDEALAEHVMSEFCKQTKVPIDEVKRSAKFGDELNSAVEEAKKDFSSTDSTTINLSYKGKDAELTVTRQKFDDLTRVLLRKTFVLTEKVIEDAKEKAEKQGNKTFDFDEIILVGGSTRMPQIEKAIADKYKGKKIRIADQDLAVAKGAALYAQRRLDNPQPKPIDPNMLTDEMRRALAKDLGIWKITSKSYGVEALNDDKVPILSNIIMKSTQIPCSKTDIFGTVRDNQSNAEIIICESDLTELTCILSNVDQKKLKSTILSLPPGLPVHSKIEVTFNIGTNGILTATARELTKGGTCEVQVNLNRLDTDEPTQLREGT